MKKQFPARIVVCCLALPTLWASLEVVCVQDALAVEILVSDRATNRILRYDAADGSSLGALVDDNLETNGGLFVPSAMAFAFDRDLFVTSIDLNSGEGQVLRYATDTGEFQEVFATGLVGPAGLAYHQASNTLLVGSLGSGLGDSNTIYRFASDGSPLAPIELGPISGRTGMFAEADGTLYVSSFAEEPFFTGSVLQYDYDRDTDSFSDGGVFAAAAELLGANGVLFDAEGDLLVASLFGQSVVKFDVENDTVVGSSVFANAAYPSGVLVAPDGTNLVSSLGNNNPNDPIYDQLFPGAVFKFDASTGAMVGQGPFLTGGAEFLPTSMLTRDAAGDFDGNGLLTDADINWLSAMVRAGTNPTAFDINEDGQVDDADRLVWVNDLKYTYLGDANLNGEFDSEDLIDVLAQSEYEDGIPGNSAWASGDWNGDTEFNSDDLIDALAEGGYEMGPRPLAVTVPEPVTSLGIWIALPLTLAARRRRHRLTWLPSKRPKAST